MKDDAERKLGQCVADCGESKRFIRKFKYENTDKPYWRCVNEDLNSYYFKDSIEIDSTSVEYTVYIDKCGSEHYPDYPFIRTEGAKECFSSCTEDYKG